jgi:phosphatidate cytidylyltransferase
MSMTSSRPARRFDWKNLGLRAISAVVLIAAVVFAMLYPVLFMLLIAVSVGLLSFEWASMTSPRTAPRVAIVVCVAVLIPLSLAYQHHFILASLLGVAGVIAAALVARGSEKPQDAALGVAYIAAPCLALMWMRAEPNPIGWTALLFGVTWGADIFAYAAGNLFKGPKLWPQVSPNKTWSGFGGGLIGAMAAAMVIGYVSTARISLGFAASIGLAGGLATMAGDLWESMLKRRYGVKDSGDLIPGHGGLLDRVDGLLFAVLAVAAARLVHQVGWAQ